MDVHSHSGFFLDGVFPLLDHSVFSLVVDSRLGLEQSNSLGKFLNSVSVKLVHSLHVCDHSSDNHFMRSIVTQGKFNCSAGAMVSILVVTASVGGKLTELFHLFLGSVISKFGSFLHFVVVLVHGVLLVLDGIFLLMNSGLEVFDFTFQFLHSFFQRVLHFFLGL